MTKIMVMDGMVKCPECDEQLYTEVMIHLWGMKILFKDEKWDYPEPLVDARYTSHEGIMSIYCEDCQFVLIGDAIHTVEVEEDDA